MSAVNELVITPEFVTNIIAVDLADETTFTTADKAKLNGIEAGAQVNTVTRVAGKTGVVELDAGDIAYDASETYESGKIGAALKSAEEKLNTINAGDIGYDGSTAYDTGTVGEELTHLNRQLSDVEENQIPELKSDLEKTNNSITADDLIFTIGAIGNAGQQYNQPNQNRINSAKTPIYALGGTISCDADYKFRVGYYSTPEIPYEVNPVSNFVKWGDWITNDSYTVESGYYILILAGKSDNSTINHAKDVSNHLNISIIVASKDVAYKNTTEITANTKLWSQGLYSASTGNYEATNYRIKQDGYIPKYIDAVYTDSPYVFRICAWDSTNRFVGVYKADGQFSANTVNFAHFAYVDLNKIRDSFPTYHFKLYAMSNTEPGTTPILPAEAEHIYFIENLVLKALDENAKFNGKTIAILGDSISTNGNSGIDANVPEITIQDADVGVELSAYLTYYDVQAGLSLGGHTFTSSEIGTEVTFTPTAGDVGKSIGLPNNYNDNVVTTWWEVMQEKLGVQCIPNTWSGASVTSHEASSNERKCSYAWHESQIRKCGVRIAGTMTRVAPDIIIIYRGTNDMTHIPYTLLTEDYFDNANWQYPATDEITGGYGYKEGLCLTIKKLRDAYPNAKIFICTLNVFKRINCSHFPTNNGINTLPQYNNAIREVADFMGCGIIEFDKDGITFENCYSQGYITDSATIPTHPNDKGHRVMGLKAIADLRAQYSDMA